MSHLRFSRQASRSTALVALASFVALSGCGAETPAPNTPFIPGPDGVEVVGQPCAEGTGVTVLVDFDALDDVIEIGCAPGAQANGLAALAAAGFSVGSEAGPGSVCTIDGLPTTGFPDCWYAGYWSYYKSPNYDTAWDYSMVGAGDGPIAAGSLEGFIWTVGFDGNPPRISVETLAAAAR